RLPGLRDPAHAGRRVGLRHQPSGLGRVLRHLVDRALSGASNRAPRDWSHAARGRAQRDDQPRASPQGEDERRVRAVVSVPGHRDGDGGPVTNEPVVSVRELRVYYGTKRGPVQAVDGVSLDIAAGEVVGLVGESGCGKSTLGRGILGLLPEGARSDGEVLYEGRNLLELSRKELRGLRGPDLGLIFQEPMTRLNPLMRIEDHFAETLKRHETDLDRGAIRTRSLETLGKMGIPPTRFRQYPYEFSGGMRQRIMIALALEIGRASCRERV